MKNVSTFDKIILTLIVKSIFGDIFQAFLLLN